MTRNVIQQPRLGCYTPPGVDLKLVIRRIAYLSIFAPCIAHGAPMDVTGISEVIFGGIAVLYTLWIAFSIAIAVATTKSTATRTTISFIIGATPIAYLFITLIAGRVQSNNLQSELKERNERITKESIPYFKKRCQEDRVNRLLKPIDWSAGVFIHSDHSKYLQLPGIPLPPERPESAQIEFYKQYPNGYNKQFRAPIYWVYQFAASNVSPGTKFLFIEDERSVLRSVGATARMVWWQEVGQNYLTEETKATLAKIIKHSTRPPNYRITLPVTASHSKYILSVKDISTVEDRLHWTARGQITLTDKETGEVIAEYIGFMRQEYPAYQPNLMEWAPAIPCDGEEQDFASSQIWDVVRFFFERVIGDVAKPGD